MPTSFLALAKGAPDALIARGSGILGTSREYLEQMAQQLETLAIDDAYIEPLPDQVNTGGEV